MQRLVVNEHKISINEGETSPLISDIALDTKTNTQKSGINLEHKTSENEISDTNAILIRLNRLTNHSRDLQTAETMLESKIVPSFLRYCSSAFLGVVNGGAIGFGLLVLMAYISDIVKGNAQTESANRIYMLAGYMECAIFIISLTTGCIGYRRDTHRNRTNGILISRYETANPLSETEASEIQNTLATIEYKGSINTTATGNDMRSASKFLADAREPINTEKSYLELRKNSLFSVWPNIPEGVKAVVLEYAVDPEKDYRSMVLTFGGN